MLFNLTFLTLISQLPVDSDVMQRLYVHVTVIRLAVAITAVNLYARTAVICTISSAHLHEVVTRNLFEGRFSHPFRPFLSFPFPAPSFPLPLFLPAEKWLQLKHFREHC